MNLHDFKIKIDKTGKSINFNDPDLANLESLLNGNLIHRQTADFFLKRLHFIRDNWTNVEARDAYIENQLVGYWEEDYLAENNLAPGWFSFLSYEDLEGYMHNSEQKIYLINDLILQDPVVEMSLADFIDVIEQWTAL